jgi:ACT domain-containing protein
MIKQKPLLILAFILLFSGCASVVSIQVVDSKGKPIDELKLELLNNEGNTITKAKHEGGGIYEISKKDISSDSFFVAIKGTDEYFPLEKKLSTRNKTNKLELEDRMTAIVGYVLDNIELSAIENCRVYTVPKTIEATTDNTGKFLLKSEQFEEIQYTVFISKTNYNSGDATFTPHDNEVDTLEQTIFLKPIKKKEFIIKDGEPTPPQGADEG